MPFLKKELFMTWTFAARQCHKTTLQKRSIIFDRTQGYSRIGIILTISVLVVALSWILFFMGHDEEKIPTPDTAMVDSAAPLKSSTHNQTALAVPPGNVTETKKSNKASSNTNDSFSKAKNALEDGNYELAEELTYNAILQELQTVKDFIGKNDSGEEDYEQAKERVAPELNKMWRFYGDIKKSAETGLTDDHGGLDSGNGGGDGDEGVVDKDIEEFEEDVADPDPDIDPWEFVEERYPGFKLCLETCGKMPQYVTESPNPDQSIEEFVDSLAASTDVDLLMDVKNICLDSCLSAMR